MIHEGAVACFAGYFFKRLAIDNDALGAVHLDPEFRTLAVDTDATVASGYRVQVREAMSSWLSKLWEERPPRYSRALMETLAIVAYRQPVTRGDIEDIRGVSVTTNIVRTLLERDWIKVVGHRDVPGKPAIFGTTRLFLDYFGLKKLEDLPPLAELADMEPVSVQLELGTADQKPPEAGTAEVAAGVADNNEPLADSAEAVAELDSDLSSVDPSGVDALDDELDEGIDVPPGAVAPLVGLHEPGHEPPEPATVSSLDEARAAAAGTQVNEDEAVNVEPADVVPLKSS